MSLSDAPPLPKFTEARRQRVLAVIDSMNISPTAINVPMRMLALQRSKSAGLADFGHALACDAALASKVLATVNSSFFSPPKPVTKISDAVRMIGLNNLLPLVFGLSLAGIFNPAELPPSDRTTLWRTALLKGIIARERARLLGAGSAVEDAFLCGLFQDIALPAMLVADRGAAMELAIVLDADDRAAREHALFGADHAEFGARLLKRMQVPAIFVNAVATHHDDSTAIECAAGAAMTVEQMISAGNSLAAAVPHRVTRTEGYRGDRLRRCYVGEKPTESATSAFYKFLGDVNVKYERLCTQLGDTDEASTAFKVFLQQVCEQVAQSMTAAIGESARTISQLNSTQISLQAKMSELESQAQAGEIDPLTEVFNRRGFMKHATKVFDVAREFHFGCLVGFIDLDNFKRINDEHGHEGGDAALKSLAASLRSAVNQQGVIGRCGGDEFVLAATVSVDQKTTLCESIERAMKTLTFPLADGTSLPITTSCGIAWIESISPTDTVADAMKRADQLMYEVKRAGKARCVISSLKAAA